MASNYNLLVTSISKKVPLLKLAKNSLENLGLKNQLFGADADDLCLGRYFVDQFWQMPPLEKLNFETLTTFCKKHNIKAIIPTRDGELAYFAKYKENLRSHGVECMISTPKAIEICLNKMIFYDFLSTANFPAIPTSEDVKSIKSDFYVVKERFGAGSNSIGLNLNMVRAKAWAKKLEHPIYQPFIKGVEYSVDIYIDRHHSAHGVIARIRKVVVNGESQITSSLKHAKIETICTQAALHLGIYGHAVFQVLEDIKGGIHMIECNPRFGGASTLSAAMGLKSFEWFIQETLEQPLTPFVRSLQEMQQVRYPEDKIIKYES